MALVKTPELSTKPELGLKPFIAVSEASTTALCKSPEKLKEVLQALQAGLSVHYVSEGDWSMNDMVLEILKLTGPAELHFTTYAISELPIRQLILAQESGDLTSVHMLIDYRAKVRTPEVFQLASMNVNKFFLTSIHAKVTVIRNAGHCITIVSSANWTKNPRIEAGVITLDRSAGDFHIEWIEKSMSNAEIFN
jgi:hypothetical protein